MGQSAKPFRDDFKDVQRLEDLSLKSFPEELLSQYIFRNKLFLQKSMNIKFRRSAEHPIKINNIKLKLSKFLILIKLRS